MTKDGLKNFSIKYLAQYIEKAQSLRSRIIIVTAAGLIEGKIVLIHENATGVFPDFINGMIQYYESDHDIDNPYMDKQRNTFITIENATLTSGGNKTRLKYLIVYLTDIIGIAMSDSEQQKSVD